MIHISRSGRKHPFYIRLLGLVLSLLALATCLAWLITEKIYEGLLEERIESKSYYKMYLEDFAGLQATQYEFSSDQGQKLVGYLYYTNKAPQGIIIFSHDLGSGQNYYMDCANYFAQNGFYVFTFDGTGHDESEGDGIRGLRQGVIDLDYAISFVETSGNFPELPIGLFGHGLGGYSACAVLDKHPEVKAVVSCSGFNKPADMIKGLLKNAMGGWSNLLMMFFKLHDWRRFGSDTSLTAMDGLAASEAAVMIINSEDNDTVPMELGFDKFYQKYKDDSRFVFVRCQEGNHAPFIDSSYLNELQEVSKNWENTLDYDTTAQENRERYQMEEDAFWKENLDRERWTNRLNLDLMGKILSFYNENLR
ncbi:MAG: alpha/beta hydrolase [Oscillospiraceae bacterium]|nr:alpha/beta hydrolase [Oscillospiraceae bacterium]